MRIPLDLTIQRRWRTSPAAWLLLLVIGACRTPDASSPAPPSALRDAARAAPSPSHGAATALVLREPPQPEGVSLCGERIHCRPDTGRQPGAFPAPYERCAPTIQIAPVADAPENTIAAFFSPMHSSRARAADPSACCYIQFLACEAVHGAAGH